QRASRRLCRRRRHAHSCCIRSPRWRDLLRPRLRAPTSEPPADREVGRCICVNRCVVALCVCHGIERFRLTSCHNVFFSDPCKALAEGDECLQYAGGLSFCYVACRPDVYLFRRLSVVVSRGAGHCLLLPSVHRVVGARTSPGLGMMESQYGLRFRTAYNNASRTPTFPAYS